MFGAILEDFTIRSQMHRRLIAITALGLDMIFFVFSSTCKPDLLTPPVYTPSDHFPNTPATLTLPRSFMVDFCSILVSMDISSSLTISTPDTCSRV